MYGPEAAPGLLSAARLTTLFSSILVTLSSGSNYVVSAYLPQLGSRLHLTHTQMNIFAVAGNFGVYTSGPFWGKAADAKGPRPLFVAAFILLLSGYSGIRGFYDNGLGGLADLSQYHFAVLVICNFLTGVGGNAGMISAINSSAKSFPDRSRAVVVGLVMSGFGLSAFFFSSISHILFPGNTSDFLLILALGTALPMIVGFFFVRHVPLPSYEISAAIERGTTDNYQPLSAAADSTVYQGQNSSSTHLLFQSEEEEEAEEREHSPRPSRKHSDALRVATSDSVELSPSLIQEGFQHRSRSRSLSVLAREPRTEKVAEGRGIDLHTWSLWKSSDFWLLCSIHVLLSGTGIMFINNAGAIAQALFAHNNPAYDEAESSVWQAAQVSIISVTNFLGRILIGIIADITKSRFHKPRSFCISLVAALFVLALSVLIYMEDVQHMWVASGTLGLAYGCLFGLFPTITIEWFGLAHFSENWGTVSISPIIGGNVFSLAFGRNLDAHEPLAESSSLAARAGLPTATQCLEGRECYVTSLYYTLGACVFALGLSIWAGRRDWLDRQQRLEHGDRMDVVEWEAAGEVAGAED